MALPRQPVSFRERVLFQFRTPANQQYLESAFRRTIPSGDPRLEFILRTNPRAVDEYGATTGQGGALIDTDPLAMRGSAFRSGNLIEELQHLNRAFYHQRLRNVTQTYNTPKSTEPAGDEPLFYQMFVADSIRPPGLEHLNGPGPLDQTHSYHNPHEKDGFAENYNPSIGPEDTPWSAGQGHRSAEAAISEYYGEESPFDAHLASASTTFYADTHLSDQQVAAPWVSGAMPGLGQQPARAGGPSVSGFENYFYSRRSTPASVSNPDVQTGRFQQREAIPHNHRGGRRTELVTGRWQSADQYDNPDGGGDVDETLGSGSAEFGGERLGHVRRWDMSRLLNPAHTGHRTLGPTH
jgi:hypothetical protein